jgi:hypothetical protein
MLMVGGFWWWFVTLWERGTKNNIIFYKRFGIGDLFFIFFFFCVDGQIFYALLWVVYGLLVNDDNAKSVTYNMVDITDGGSPDFYPSMKVFEVIKIPLSHESTVFSDPLCGLVVCWMDLTGDATGVCFR